MLFVYFTCLTAYCLSTFLFGPLEYSCIVSFFYQLHSQFILFPGLKKKLELGLTTDFFLAIP